MRTRAPRLLLFAELLVASACCSPVWAEFARPPIPESRLIDERIAVAAQRALRSVSEREGEDRETAWIIMKTVKSGALGGIYQVDMGVPAMRIRKAGGNWWEVLGDETAMCLRKPGESPIIVYSEKIGNNSSALEEPLLAAFRGCQFAMLYVNVTYAANPACVDHDDVVVRNAELGIETETCGPVDGRCRFMLPRNHTFDVKITCAGESQEQRVFIPPDASQAELDFAL